METLDENAKAMQDLEKPWEQKLKEEKERNNVSSEAVYTATKDYDRKVPHLTNLNEDPQLTGKVYYSLIDCKSPLYLPYECRPCLCRSQKWLS